MADVTAGPAPTPDRVAHRGIVLTVCCLTAFMGILDTTVVNVAVPAIQADLGTSIAEMQWVVAGYTMVFAALLITGGAIADLHGRRRALIGGVAGFVAGSAVAATAGSAPVLIAGRLVGGAGAAFMTPATLAVITATFDEDVRPRAIGIWSAAVGLALAAGPVLGGAIATALGWQYVFLVNVPIGLVVVALGVAVLPRDHGRRTGRRLDVPGVVLSATGFAALTVALMEGDAYGWHHRLIVSCLLVAAGALVGFLVWETRTASPLIPLRFFRIGAFSGSLAVIMIMNMAVGAVFLYLAFYYEAVRGMTPFATGLLYLPTTLTIVVVSPVVGALATRNGARGFAALGMSVAAAGLLLFSQVGQDTGLPLLLAAQALVGVGSAFAITPLAATVVASVPPDDAGVAAASDSTSGQVGLTLGVALIGAVIALFATNAYRSALAGADVPPAIQAAALAEFQPLADPNAATTIDAPPEVQRALVDATNHAFIDGFRWAMAACAALCAGGALIAALALPRRRPAATVPT